MATKSKTGAYGKTEHRAGKPKTTSIGQGRRSRLRNKKKLRGQGR